MLLKKYSLGNSVVVWFHVTIIPVDVGVLINLILAQSLTYVLIG